MLYYKNENNEIFAYERAEEAPQGMVEIETPIFGGKVLPKHKALQYDEEGNITNEDVVALQVALKTQEDEATFRAERNQLLSECDIMINKAEDNGEDTTALRTYRQALRDATIDWVMPTLGELAVEAPADPIDTSMYDIAIQQYVNATISTLGYNSLSEASTLAGYVNPREDEAKRILEFNGECWSKGQTIKAQVESGEITDLSIEEFKAMLPKYTV